MGKIIKGFIFALGLVALAGLGLCAGMSLWLSSDGGEAARSERFANLETHITNNTASVFQQWQYARLLRFSWANEHISPDLVGTTREQMAKRYLQHSLDRQLPEAMVDKALMLIKDNNSTEDQQLKGLALLRNAYQHGCLSSYHDKFESYNWYAKDPRPLGNYLPHITNKTNHTRFQDELGLLQIYEYITCADITSVEKQLVNLLVDDNLPVFHRALAFVVATKIKKPDIAELMARKVKPKDTVFFDEKVAWLNREYDKRFANHPTRAMIKRVEEQAESARLDNTLLQEN